MSTAPPIRVLLAEDEAPLAVLLAQFLGSHGHDVTTVHDGAQALAALRADAFDVALLDLVMPQLDGLEVLRRVRDDPAPPECIIITGNGAVDTAIAAMRLGAYDYVSKPYRMAEIDLLVRRAWERRRLARENAGLHARLASRDPLTAFVTRHPPLQAVLATLERVAATEAPVLITGESGTGKEIVARAIHHLSGRGPAPLVDIACAAMGGASVEVELFGSESDGAAVGGPRAGLLEIAAGGTLFMDEIAALDRKLQAALLRVLERGDFHRVGGVQKVAMTARLITATNGDIPALVASGSFRDDLYYRINTFHVAIPPLRERRCDIAPLARHFLTAYTRGAPRVLSEPAVHALERHEWPGNVRELRNVIERAALLGAGEEIGVRDLALPAPTVDVPSVAESGPLPTLEELERQHIARVLERARWHQGRAAEILGISSKTLYRKIREFGLGRPTPYHSSA